MEDWIEWDWKSRNNFVIYDGLCSWFLVYQG